MIERTSIDGNTKPTVRLITASVFTIYQFLLWISLAFLLWQSRPVRRSNGWIESSSLNWNCTESRFWFIKNRQLILKLFIRITVNAWVMGYPFFQAFSLYITEVYEWKNCGLLFKRLQYNNKSVLNITQNLTGFVNFLTKYFFSFFLRYKALLIRMQFKNLGRIVFRHNFFLFRNNKKCKSAQFFSKILTEGLNPKPKMH